MVFSMHFVVVVLLFNFGTVLWFTTVMLILCDISDGGDVDWKCVCVCVCVREMGGVGGAEAVGGTSFTDTYVLFAPPSMFRRNIAHWLSGVDTCVYFYCLVLAEELTLVAMIVKELPQQVWLLIHACLHACLHA